TFESGVSTTASLIGLPFSSTLFAKALAFLISGVGSFSYGTCVSFAGSFGSVIDGGIYPLSGWSGSTGTNWFPLGSFGVSPGMYGNGGLSVGSSGVSSYPTGGCSVPGLFGLYPSPGFSGINGIYLPNVL